MKTLTAILLTLLIVNPLVVFGQQGNPNVGELDSHEEAMLVFLREEEKLARDCYLSMIDLWGTNVFFNISESEQRHMDTLLKKLILFEIEDPITSDEPGVFTDPDLDQLYDELVDSGSDSLLDALLMGAFIEELSISQLLLAIEGTDEPPLIKAYSNILAGSRNHLRAFVSHIEALGVDYSAQHLDQETVEEIIADLVLPPSGDFKINRGLNDAWFNPETSGQGFYVTVYPDLEVVFLGWVTFDTSRPGDDVSAELGGPGQRWMTAQGKYSGAQAELAITNTTGGVFDTDIPEVTNEPYGSILLQFENCNSGSVIYDIPSLQLIGYIPIQRIAHDNMGECARIAEIQD